VSASGVDYAAVLEDARGKRAALDKLIEALEALAGVAAPGPAALPPAPKASEDRAVSRARPSRPAAPKARSPKDHEALVLQALRNGPMGPKAIQVVTGINKWTLVDLTAALVAARKLKRTGNRRSLRYELT